MRTTRLCLLIGLAGCGAAESPDGVALAPLANVYRVNPVEDPETIQVQLRHLESADGSLAGRWANVWNCVAREGGRRLTVDLGQMQISGSLCQFERTAAPGPGGDYLHIAPPPKADATGPSSFAEVMMYHHLTALHDHYRERYGIKHIDKPVRAIVNLQGYVDAFGRWIGLPNANFIPVEHTKLLKSLVGVDILEGEEALVFGYNNISPQIGQVNFAFDAMTIYHEYTHFTIGGQRLLEPAVDRYGPDASPIALNEAFADYFPSSFLDTPLAGGTYTLGKLARNLDNDYRHPEHLTGETHIDGEVASGAFWELRRMMGTRTADTVLWNAALSFTLTTSFDLGSQAILAEIKRLAPEHHDAAKQVLVERGLLGGDRLKTHEDYDNNGPLAAYSPMVEGRFTAPAVFQRGGVPGYVQHRVTLDQATRQVTIGFTPLVGAMAQGPAARGDVSVAVRRGSSPITYDYSGEVPVSSAHAVLKGAAVGDTGYRLTLSGACVEGGGDLVFQFINHGDDAATITSVKVTQSETVTTPTPTFSSCD
jgi:hypothetical protein